MNTPLLTWSCIIGLVILILIIDAMRGWIHSHRRRNIHVFGICREREMFYLPGDPDPNSKDEYADDED